jgi:hypothetical protein
MPETDAVTECPPGERVKALSNAKDPRRWRRARCEPYQELGCLLADLEDVARGLQEEFGAGAASGPTLLSAEVLASKRGAVRLALEVTRRNILAILTCREAQEEDLAPVVEVVSLQVRTVAERGY